MAYRGGVHGQVWLRRGWSEEGSDVEARLRSVYCQVLDMIRVKTGNLRVLLLTLGLLFILPLLKPFWPRYRSLLLLNNPVSDSAQHLSLLLFNFLLRKPNFLDIIPIR